jgi:ribose transport system ATP-binding protein
MHSKREIMRIVREYAAQGKGVIFVSSEFKEMAEFCDVVYVMRKGEIAERVKDAVTEDRLMRLVQ